MSYWIQKENMKSTSVLEDSDELPNWPWKLKFPVKWDLHWASYWSHFLLGILILPYNPRCLGHFHVSQHPQIAPRNAECVIIISSPSFRPVPWTSNPKDPLRISKVAVCQATYSCTGRPAELVAGCPLSFPTTSRHHCWAQTEVTQKHLLQVASK